MSKPRTTIMAAAAAFALALSITSAQADQFDSNMNFNISGVYMLANDSDLYYDFAGFSMRFGVYVLPCTEIFVDTIVAGGLDLQDNLDESMNWGVFGGITQYAPLNERFALYVRGRVGVVINYWEASGPDYYYDDYGYWYEVDNKEEDAYFAAGIGAGASIELADNISLELGYDYIVLDVSDQFDDDYEISGGEDDWAGYHTIHAGIDIKF